MKHLLIIISLLLLSSPLFGQSSKLGKVEIGANKLIHVLLNPVEKRKKGERSFMSVRSLSKGAHGKNLSLLAKELMLWMQANCNVPGVHPEHNFCNLNLNHPLPVITILPQKELSIQFRINNGTLPGGDSSDIMGFFLRGTNEIYVKDQDYSNIIYQSDLLHELVHYIQNENGLLGDCPPDYEIPAYLVQIHYYREKTGQGATAEMIDEYKKNTCNILY